MCSSNNVGMHCLQLSSYLFHFQGNSNFFHKVNLAQRICWSTILKVDAKAPELILLFETGTIEIR